MKIIYTYRQSSGRSGELKSVFVATAEQVTELKSAKEICLGEVLGKHSEVFAKLDDTTIKEVSDDQTVVAFLEKHFSGVIGTDLLECYGERKADGLL